MRIFRQQTFTDWAPAFGRIAIELRKVMPTTVPMRMVVIEAGLPLKMQRNLTLNIDCNAFSTTTRRGRLIVTTPTGFLATLDAPRLRFLEPLDF